MRVEEDGAEKLRKSIDEAFDSLEKKIRDLGRRVEEEASMTARNAVAEVKEILRSFRRSLEDIVESLKSLEGPEGSKAAEELARYVMKRARDLRRMVEDLADKIRSKYESKGPGAISISLGLAEKMSRPISLWLGMVERSFDYVERKLERISTTLLTTRIRDDDLKIIDSLVKGGVFRDRGEAVSFFTHKGIEASMELISGVEAKLKKIKELQDEIRSEIAKEMEDEDREGSASKS